MNTTLKLIAIFLLGLFSSCVSLKTPQRNDLTPLTAATVLGKYPVKVNDTVSWKNKTDTVFVRMLWSYFEGTEIANQRDLATATHIEVELLNAKQLKATLLNNSSVLRTVNFKGKLKKGYFRNKHYFELTGVPPFYWSSTSVKTQFGLGTGGQLFIDIASETNGGILIITAGTPGFTRSLTAPAYQP